MKVIPETCSAYEVRYLSFCYKQFLAISQSRHSGFEFTHAMAETVGVIIYKIRHNLDFVK